MCDEPGPSCSKSNTRSVMCCSPSMFSESEDENMDITKDSVDIFDSPKHVPMKTLASRTSVNEYKKFSVSREDNATAISPGNLMDLPIRTVHNAILNAVPEAIASDPIASTSADHEEAIQDFAGEAVPKRKSLLPLDIMHLNTETSLNTLKSFGDYMRLKKDKLLYQVNVISKPTSKESNLFEGVSIFVNGYTVPSALELRQLIQSHGGEFHVYYEYGKTTYTLATSLASVKVDKTRVNEKILRPEWVTDSLTNKRLMPEEPYLLLWPHQKTDIRSILSGKKDEEVVLPVEQNANKHKTLDARDPNFISEYYARSRLHLISTMAQDMRDYVNSMRMDGKSLFEYRLTFKEKMSGNGFQRTPPGHVIFHVDLDCFFVSVALRHRHDLIGKPVAVTHSKGNAQAPGYAEIASCSYEARSKGIKNGMLIRDALQKCPDLVCVPYEFKQYTEVSKTIYTIMSRYTLDIRAVSCDEMYLDVGGLLRDVTQNDAYALAEDMRQRIKEQTGCPASVGIGPNQLIARLATRHAKPNGVWWVKTEDVVKFIALEKITNLPGIGHSTLSKIESNFGEVEFCGELQPQSKDEMIRVMGKGMGTTLYRMCRGEDETTGLGESGQRKSVSCDINYGIRFTKIDEAYSFLGAIGAELEKKLSSARLKTGSLTLKVLVRAANAPVQTAKFLGCGRCDSYSKSTLLQPNTGSGKLIAAEAVKLLKKIKVPPHELRGIGIQLGRLVPSGIKNVAKGSGRTESITKMFFPRKPLSQNAQKKADKLEDRPSRPSSTESSEGLSVNIYDLAEKPKKIPEKKEEILDFDEVEQLDEKLCPDVIDLCTTPPPRIPLQSRDPPLPPRSTLFCDLTPKGLERKIAEIMSESPSKPLVESLTDHTYSLIRYGRLSTLRQFVQTLNRVSKFPNVAHLWYQTTVHMTTVADQLLIRYFGSPMFTDDLY